ncbi:hypothetical protein [Janibacter hoylei]
MQHEGRTGRGEGLERLPDGMAVESRWARVSTTDWATSGTVSSRPSRAAVAA